MDPFGGRFFQWGNDDKPWGNDDKPCNFNAALTKKHRWQNKYIHTNQRKVYPEPSRNRNMGWTYFYGLVEFSGKL